MLYELRRYDDRLARLGLADRSLDWRVSPRAVARFALREALLALLLSPLTLGGLLLFYVPYRATGALARRITSNLDLLATVQVFAGAVVYGLWFALAVAVAAALGGRTAAWIAVLGLPLFSVLALLAIERQSAVWSTVRDWLQLRRAPLTARARLVRHRSVLAEMLDEVRDWLAATPRAGSANRRG